MCYCHNCKRYFHPLGIMSHRAVHRRRQENCTITYSHGDTYEHNFAPSNKVLHTDAAKPPLTEEALQILEQCFPYVREQ